MRYWTQCWFSDATRVLDCPKLSSRLAIAMQTLCRRNSYAIKTQGKRYTDAKQTLLFATDMGCASDQQPKMYIKEDSSRSCQFYHCKVFKSFPYDIHVLTVLMQLLYPLPIHDIHLLTRAGIIMKSSLSFHNHCLLIILQFVFKSM